MKQLTLLLFLCLFVPSLTAQQMITGVVIDDTSGEPLPYVNVFLESNQSRGVLTNEKGEYAISLTVADQSDRLMLSLLSYRTHAEPVADVLQRGFFNLRMETSFVSLGEVVVISDLGLRGLMNKVFAAIPDNYGTDDFTLTAYSRNYQIDDGRYSQFVEAVVNIKDQRYGQRTREGKLLPLRSRVEQFRINRDTVASLRDRWKPMSQQWRLTSPYTYNTARRGNYRKWKSDARYLDELSFSYRGEYLDGTDTLVRIGYHPTNWFGNDIPADLDSLNDGSFWFLAGEYLINKNDLAIIRHTVGDADRGYLDDVIYRRVNGKYYLRQAVRYIEIEYENDTRQFIDHNMLYVTDVVTGAKNARKALKGKYIDSREDLAELRVKYDPEFWATNPFLSTLSAPEEMQLTMERMQRRVEELKGKKIEMERDSSR